MSFANSHDGTELNALGRGAVVTLWFVNNIKVRLVGVVISGLMMAMLVVGIGSGVWSAIKVDNIATHWRSFDSGSASKRGIMDQIRARLGYGGLLYQIKEIAARPGDTASAASAAKQSTGQLRSLVSAYRSAGMSPTEERAAAALLAVITAYDQALDGVARNRSPEALAALLAVRDDSAIAALAVLAAEVKHEAETSSRAVDAAVTNLTVTNFSSLTLNSILLLVLAVFFHWFTRHRIVAPLDAMGQVMARLTHGDKSVEVPFQEKRDEIGDMARAVQVFKDNAIRLDRMAEDRRHAEQAAETAKRTEMQSLADRFEREVKGVVDAVSGAANELQLLAQNMTAMADRAESSTDEVANASSQVSGDVTATAAAAEQLSASIQEIRRQVDESSTIAGRAVRDAGKARSVMGELSTASERIGDIVQLIEGLAQRIDLLALNATIEAMRAGDMGKGFAVVAGEVKSLSQQTAKATGSITEQIAAIKKVSAAAVLSIGDVCAVIERMDSIAGTVAAAVNQQSEATAEITQGADRTAAASRIVSERMGEVTQLSNDTGAAARHVLNAASRLGEDAARLSTQVGAFVAHVRS